MMSNNNHDENNHRKALIMRIDGILEHNAQSITCRSVVGSSSEREQSNNLLVTSCSVYVSSSVVTECVIVGKSCSCNLIGLLKRCKDGRSVDIVVHDIDFDNDGNSHDTIRVGMVGKDLNQMRSESHIAQTGFFVSCYIENNSQCQTLLSR